MQARIEFDFVLGLGAPGLVALTTEKKGAMDLIPAGLALASLFFFNDPLPVDDPDSLPSNAANLTGKELFILAANGLAVWRAFNTKDQKLAKIKWFVVALGAITLIRYFRRGTQPDSYVN